MRSPRRRGWLQKLSRRLTFNKLTLGNGHQTRRSRRLNTHEAELLSTTPGFITTIIGWLGNRVGWLVMIWIFAILLYIAFGTTWFYIYDIEVEGVERLTKEEVYNRSKLEGWSIFWLNTDVVSEMLQEEPLVRRAVVSRRPPNRVRIQIHERVPVAIWQSGDIHYFVDSEGVLFNLREPIDQLPIVRDLHANFIKPNDKVDPIIIRTVQELAELMPEQNFFEWEPNHGVFLTTEEQWRVIFGDYTRLSVKVAAFRAFFEQYNSDKDILWLDLSAPEHPYFQKKSGPSP